MSVTDSKSAKILTNVSSFADVQKSLQEVQKVLDKVEESVNKKTDNPGEEYEGRPGDIRTVLDNKDSYSFEINTKDGWKRPYLRTDIADDVEIVLRNRPALVAKPKEKKLNLIPEDTGKVMLARPDYESDWLLGTQAVTTVIEHNLNLTTLPSLVQWFISDTENPVIGTNFIIANYNILNENWGVIVELEDKDTIRFHIGHDGGIYHPGDNYFGDLSIPNYFRNGYFKIKIWK